MRVPRRPGRPRRPRSGPLPGWRPADLVAMAVALLVVVAMMVPMVLVVREIAVEQDLLRGMGTARAPVPAVVVLVVACVGLWLLGGMLVDVVRYVHEVVTGARPRLRGPRR
ncbi:hypothetical protein [Nocardioides sp.]|uniref:hypothetical protein n=1 Tax=Nocardioides sp. TaxID=35761 RepID=UPI00351167B5